MLYQAKYQTMHLPWWL